MTAFDGGDVARLIERARQALQTVGRAGAAPERQHTGSAADGAIRAIVAGGRLQSVRIGTPAAHLTPAELGEQIVVAVNGAFAAAAGSAMTTVDATRLADQLRELQDQSVGQMRAFGESMNDVLAQIRRAGA